MTDFADRLQAVRERIVGACERAGRDPDEITLVAISKRHLAEAAQAAVDAGAVDLGENYVQEMVDKQTQVRGARWHYVGRLQRNKAKHVVGVHLIHCVDSVKLVAELAKRAEAGGIRQSVLVAVNIAGEESKSGVSPSEAATLVAAISDSPSLLCEGLMTMEPQCENPEDDRKYFRGLRELRDQLATEQAPLPVLSMGTTSDFEIAIEEGATHVRVGTALFGPRPA